jgi:hypothetical protein
MLSKFFQHCFLKDQDGYNEGKWTMNVVKYESQVKVHALRKLINSSQPDWTLDTISLQHACQSMCRNTVIEVYNYRWYNMSGEDWCRAGSQNVACIKHTSESGHCPSRQGYEGQQAEQVTLMGKTYKILVRKPLGRLKDVVHALVNLGVRMFNLSYSRVTSSSGLWYWWCQILGFHSFFLAL